MTDTQKRVPTQQAHTPSAITIVHEDPACPKITGEGSNFNAHSLQSVEEVISKRQLIS